MSGNGAVVKWEVPSRMSWDEWKSRMRDAAIEVRERAWYLGDLLNYGIEHWPAECWQYISNIKLAHETLMNYKSIAGKIPKEERNGEVPFTIYQDIASLPKPQRDRIVGQYLGGKLNRAEIRALKNGGTLGHGNGASDAADGVSGATSGLPDALGLAVQGFVDVLAEAGRVVVAFSRDRALAGELRETLDRLTDKAMALREIL